MAELRVQSSEPLSPAVSEDASTSQTATPAVNQATSTSEPATLAVIQDTATNEPPLPAVFQDTSTSQPSSPVVSKNTSTNKPLTPAVPQNKPTGEPIGSTVLQDKSSAQSETILQDVLDTMHDSDIFPRVGKDAPSRFWSAYERLAKQHDDEFLDRHNGDMDVLLIFAGLFSAVSAAFIVNLETNLSPNPTNATNVLLMILINKIDNGTFPEQNVGLPTSQGLNFTQIWVQTLAHASLSTSLLAAFGAVLAKQWLGHYKTSRFGRGSLHERCKRRQLKLDGLKSWHFSTIVATLPIFLQLSLLFFGIALSANIWTQEHTVASVIIATTAFGVTFYSFTVLASLTSPDCPFQTPVSIVLKRIPGLLLRVSRGAMSFGNAVQKRWEERPKAWSLNGMVSTVRTRWENVQHAVTVLIARFATYFLAKLSALMYRSRGPVDDPELPSTGGAEHSASQAAGDLEKYTHSDRLDLGHLESPVELAEVHAVQWILEISTDTDIITAAARMIPEIEWPENITGVLHRLDSHLYASFDPARQLSPLAQKRAVACVKAMYHFYVERNLDTPFFIGDGDIFKLSDDGHSLYQMHAEQGFLFISCAVDDPNELLNIASLTLSDRTWMAHMFTYRLHDGAISPKAVTFVLDFIYICLLDQISPGRLVSDCLLLAGLLMGLRTDRQQLARLDKSAAIETLRQSVMDRMLAVLFGEVPDSLQGIRYTQIARRLFKPLIHDRHKSFASADDLGDKRMSERFLRLYFHLEEEQGAEGVDKVQSRDLAILLRFSLNYSPLQDDRNWYLAFELGPYDWHTPDQFDLLVDYHASVCNGRDYRAIFDAFVVLAGLRGSPRGPKRQRRYIQTTIRFMDSTMPRRVRYAALNAAFSVRSVVASIGREDESLREQFSQALTSAVLGRQPTITPVYEDTFNTPFFSESGRNLCYLRLLCTLAQEPAWRNQLYKDGHFDNCLGIANALSTRKGDKFGAYAVHVTHIIAIVDAAGEENPILNMAIQMYPIMPLVLQAWHFIFGLDFFESATEDNWMKLCSTGYPEALSCQLGYAKRRGDNRAETDRLIGLVEWVCKKLDEENERSQLDVVQVVHDNHSFGHQGIPA